MRFLFIYIFFVFSSVALAQIDNGSVRIGVNTDSLGALRLPNYDALRAYDGKAEVIVIPNWQYDFKGETFETIGGVFVETYGPFLEDGATFFVGQKNWKRVFDGKTYFPEWLEVGGFCSRGLDFIDEKVNNGTFADPFHGGILNDCDRLRHIEKIAGANATFELNTIVSDYYCDMNIGIDRYQVWNGHGVNFRRMNSPRHSVIAGAGVNIPGSGTVNITLNSVDSLRIGQEVLLLNTNSPSSGREYNENGSPNPAGFPVVVAISGKDVTLRASTAGQSVPASSILMVLTSPLHGQQGGDMGTISVNEINYYGNRDNGGNDWFSSDWRIYYSLELGNVTLNAVANYCNFYDAPCEAVTWGAGNLNSCVFQNNFGSGFHISAGAGVDVVGVTFDDCIFRGNGQIPDSMSHHSEADITFSANPLKVIVKNCRFEGGGEKHHRNRTKLLRGSLLYK